MPGWSRRGCRRPERGRGKSLRREYLDQSEWGIAMVAFLLLALIAVVHLYILVIEMLLWETPRVRRIFGTTAEFAAATKAMAGNQGLYNGFLAAGLFWGLSLGAAGASVKVFFLLCVLVAGLYGAATASRKILFIQAIPAAIGLALVLMA